MEAAFVLPVLLLFIAAILDGGIWLMGTHSVDAGARSGGRSASAAANDRYADFVVLAKAKQDLNALDRGQLRRIVVYKAGGPGEEPTSGCRAGFAQRDTCNVYTSADLDRPETDFGCQSTTSLDGPWCPTTRKTAQRGPDGPPDFVGVYVEAEQRLPTGIFGTDKVLSSYAVYQVEPRRSAS